MGEESAQEMIDRLSLIALGERECDLSDNDAAALQWLLSNRADLLAALKSVMSWIDNWSPTFTEDGEWPPDRDAARAAIAKAEGR